MRFICQIALSDEHFCYTSHQMAYIFMTEEMVYVDGTWEPDGSKYFNNISFERLRKLDVNSINGNITIIMKDYTVH